MKNILKAASLAILTAAISFPTVYAGNDDRSGQSGANELLINPWGRTSGWANANTANVRGFESMGLNVAGLAFTKKTEMMFANTTWLKGTDIKMNAFGFSQKLGKDGGVLAVSIMSMNFGDIDITTTELPEGGIGKFSPRFMNMGIGFAKEFSNSIYGGVNVKIISESIADLKAQGVAFDAGIQYHTTIGAKAKEQKIKNVKFGISLRNVGPPLCFSGDGLSTRATLPITGTSLTVEQRSTKFELPALINIGGAYDHYLMEEKHRITGCMNFTSNSFIKDQFAFGLEYGYKSMFMGRVGYAYESKKDGVKMTALSGPTAGFTVELPLNKEKGTAFGLDYGYRFTNPFAGCHTIGVKLTL